VRVATCASAGSWPPARRWCWPTNSSSRSGAIVHEQAYREIRDDGHPIVVFSGADIVNTLRAVGLTTIPALRAWLDQEFPVADADPTASGTPHRYDARRG